MKQKNFSQNYKMENKRSRKTIEKVKKQKGVYKNS